MKKKKRDDIIKNNHNYNKNV